MPIRVQKPWGETREVLSGKKTRGRRKRHSILLTLDERGIVSLRVTDGDVETPEDVWTGCTRQWLLPPDLSAQDADHILADETVLTLLDRVHAGHRIVENDGPKRYGRLGPEAFKAEIELEHHIRDRVATRTDRITPSRTGR